MILRVNMWELPSVRDWLEAVIRPSGETAGLPGRGRATDPGATHPPPAGAA